MSNIKQKDTDKVFVVLDDYEGEVSDHPSIADNPTLFEIYEGELPEDITWLMYSDGTEEPYDGGE